MLIPLLLWIALELFEDPNILHLKIVLPILLISGIIIFLLGLKKCYAFEEISLEKDKIISLMFGTLHFEDLKKYNVIRYFGTDSLVITMNNKIKFSLAPAKGGFTNFTQKQYDEFLKEFIKNIEAFNNEIGYSSKEKIKKEVSQIEKVSAIFILIIVIAIDLYILYNFINGNGFFPIQLLFLNFMLIYSIHILRNK